MLLKTFTTQSERALTRNPRDHPPKPEVPSETTLETTQVAKQTGSMWIEVPCLDEEGIDLSLNDLLGL